MPYNLLADLIVLLHFAFALFAVFGALLAIGWPKIIWLHLPAVLWAAWVEFSGRICPLTPLENWLRIKGGGAAYSGDFIAHYVMPILYPSGLTRRLQIILGLAVVVINLIIYAYVFFLIKKKRFN